MLRRYKINEYGQKYLNSKPSVKKILLENKIISEHAGAMYIVKGEPVDGITVHIKHGRISHGVKVTKDGFVFGRFFNGNSRVNYYLPISVNSWFTEKVFSTYNPGEVVYSKGNKIMIKGEPNLLAVLLYESNMREMPLDDMVKEWEKTVKHLEQLEGTYRVWS